jgi:hypothetical protein
MIENNNMPAFPISCGANETGIYSLLDARYGFDHIGLTKREYFAVIALQGLLSNPNYFTLTTRIEIVASDAVTLADALFAELSKPQP